MTTSKTEQKTTPLQSMPTRGEGDCAFHAILGTWDAKQQQFVCSAVEAQRAKVANAVKTQQELRPRVIEGIQDLIARVFGITVQYRPTPTASLESLNPGQAKVVAVQFNGRNHYEQLDTAEVTQSLLRNNIPARREPLKQAKGAEKKRCLSTKFSHKKSNYLFNNITFFVTPQVV
jgi:hypothetical protein